MRRSPAIAAGLSLPLIAFASACGLSMGGGASGSSALSAGGNQTCLIAAGGAKCWGDNRVGQLGDGTMENRNVPTPVTILSEKPTAIAVGYTYACALTASGGIFCWGSMVLDSPDGGQFDGYRAVAAGTTHICGLTTSGGVKCWGSNAFGALGDGSTEDRPVPVEVSGLGRGVSAIAVGVDFSCAVHNRGVKCWGSNDTGQLGNGSYSGSIIPSDASGLQSDVAGIAAGVFHACAWKTSGEVWCWGDNLIGELGDGSGTNSPFPVRVIGLEEGAKAVAVGGSHTCALTKTGGVNCWGGNSSGQLGDGSTTDRNAPATVSGLSSGVAAIAAGGSHTCALLDNGSVKCWGLNDDGQLGNGGNANSNTPVNVAFPAG
ncbi:MAG: hypothetical protein JW929_09490 [Anaerolineales bacterium]|nr:hypothetical protein [Anaerolineales bacterium]